MPYVSDKQRGYFHAQKGKKVPADVVDKFDREERAKHGKADGKTLVAVMRKRRMAKKSKKMEMSDDDMDEMEDM